jgi:predicted PurR-regulated permease PerM
MNLNLTTATRYGLNILALLGASVALQLGQSIFVPLTIATLLAAIMWPYASALKQRFRLPWFFACLSVIGLLVVGVVLVFLLVGLAIPQMVSDLPSSETQRREMYERFRGQLERSVPFAINDQFPRNPEESGFYQQIQKLLTGDYITKGLIDLTKIGGMLFFQAVLILFVLLFLLLEGQMLVNKVRNIFGPGLGVQKKVTDTIGEMALAVRSYLVWRTLVNFGLALLLGVVYHTIGLKQATLWGVLTFILCYVPYLGTIAAGVPPILEALILPNQGAGTAFGILIFYTAVVTFEGYIIVPWVMGRSMDLNATTVLLACLYWDLVWGTAGLFLAMPLMAAIKSVCMHVEGWSAWGHLMSSEDMPVPEAVPDVPKVPGDPAGTVVQASRSENE